MDLREINQRLDALFRQATEIPQIPPPTTPPIRWVAVKWDWDLGQFDPTTMRQEPDACELRNLKRPYTWPWVYLPAFVRMGVQTLPAAQYIGYINEQCHWQKDRHEIAKFVRSYGGEAFFTGVDIGPNDTPAPRFRQAIIPRRRSRTRQGDIGHGVLRRVIQREELLAMRRPDPHAQPHELVSTGKKPIPVPDAFIPGTKAKGESEEEFRERVGLETMADGILRALECQPEPQPVLPDDLQRPLSARNTPE